eukprot:scpid93699/ scgid28821/ 
MPRTVLSSSCRAYCGLWSLVALALARRVSLLKSHSYAADPLLLTVAQNCCVATNCSYRYQGCAVYFKAPTTTNHYSEHVLHPFRFRVSAFSGDRSKEGDRSDSIRVVACFTACSLLLSGLVLVLRLVA